MTACHLVLFLQTPRKRLEGALPLRDLVPFFDRLIFLSILRDEESGGNEDEEDFVDVVSRGEVSSFEDEVSSEEDRSLIFND